MKKATPPATARDTPCILIVEDNSVNQLLMMRKFRNQGYHSLLLAKNGQEAIDLALKNRTDLILMDIQLPDMSGNEAIRSLRRQGFTGPIMAVSADNRQEDIDNSRAAGADGFISKPIDFDALFTKIHEHMQYGREGDKRSGRKTGEGKKARSVSQALPIREPVSEAARNVLIMDAKEKLPVITNALEHFDQEDQVERIKAIAHEYKGIAGYFGLHELERVAQELDAGFKNDEHPEYLMKLTGQLAALVEGIIHNENA